MVETAVPPRLASKDQVDDNRDASITIIRSYLLERSSVFRDLQEVRDEVWKRPEADAMFARRKHDPSVPTLAARDGLYKTMLAIGDELQATKKIIPQSEDVEGFEVLDLCMAPGGYSATVLKHNKHAKIYGLSLPGDEGGLDILLPDWQNDPRVQVLLFDITMLDAALGYPDLLPSTNRWAPEFSSFIPCDGRKFDLVFCDGKIQASHSRTVGSMFEATRLATAQLILALQRIKNGGTIVMLLHGLDKPHKVTLLQGFDEFAEIDLFKPSRAHVHRNSFYLVAKKIDPRHPKACQMLETFKESWRINTLKAFGPRPTEDIAKYELHADEMEDRLRSFGEKLISLGEPIWKLQMDGLRRIISGNSWGQRRQNG